MVVVTGFLKHHITRVVPVYRIAFHVFLQYRYLCPDQFNINYETKLLIVYQFVLTLTEHRRIEFASCALPHYLSTSSTCHHQMSNTSDKFGIDEYIPNFQQPCIIDHCAAQPQPRGPRKTLLINSLTTCAVRPSSVNSVVTGWWFLLQRCEFKPLLFIEV